MKKKSTSNSAFFNVRVLAGLLVGMTGISLALFAANPLGRRTGSSLASPKSAQLQQKYNASTSPFILPPGFDCSKIHQLGLDKAENLKAGMIMIACGASPGGQPTPAKGLSKFVKSLLPSLLAFGGTDVDLITGTESFPNVTQSETYSLASPEDPSVIVVAYNDSRGVAAFDFSGVSVSTDGGTTFTRVTNASGQSPFPDTLGDPVLLYNQPTHTWFAVWLDFGCGGGVTGGVGYYKSTTPWDPNSWTHGCIHTNTFDDRESGWSDNNPSSPFFGRMYVSWNDFNTSCGAGGCLFVTFSSDNGATWSSPHQLSTGTFIRDVQITGDMSGNGDVYIAGMDEGGGGFPHNDTNLIYKSTDGGATWANTYVGTPFPGPGVTACSDNPYFSCMFPDQGGYWRHEGWGQPAAYNGVVHLVYSQQGTGGDPGDVYYIRSTDGGVTFGAPLKLNTDSTTRPQWQVNLSVSPTGTLLATWYDARESASCTKGDPNVPCYRMWSRKSNDNGLSWLPDDTLSDVVSPLPGQPDPNIVTGYAGDYDYGSAVTTKHVTSWTDGRVTLSGQSQQDAFTDRELVGFAVTTSDPACGSFVVGAAPTDFVVNLSDPADPSTVQASDFTVNGTAADTATLSNGNATITFHFNSSPVVQGENTMHIDAGAILQASNNDPILEFNCTFRFAVTQLEVTDTDPPVGGTFSGPGTRTYDVNFNEAFDPASLQTTDLTLSGVAATVTNVTATNGNTTAEFTINFTDIFSGTLTASIAAGAITDPDGNPCAAFSGQYQYNGNVCDSGIIQNEGFETGDFTGWVIDGHVNDPVISTAQVHSGVFSALAGNVSGPEPGGDSSFYQQFTVPAGGGTLSFWHWDFTTDSITFDWQDVYITDAGGTILQTIFHQCENGNTWINQLVDMAPYAGQTVRIKFLVHQDAFGDDTGMYVDDVVLFVPCASPTPSPTVPPSPTPTPTPSATPSPSPSPTPRETPTPRPRPTPHPRP
jgi:hypothetical protein